MMEQNNVINDLENELDKLIAEAESERTNTGENDDNKSMDNDTDTSSDNLDNVSNEAAEHGGDAVSDVNKQEESTDYLSVKINGLDVKFNNKEEIADYISKQSSKPSVDTLAYNNLSKTDIALLKDIKSGNLAAIKKVIDDNKIDLVDIEDFKGEYVPANTFNEPTELEIAAMELSKDTELMAEMTKIQDHIPIEFKTVVGANVDDFRMFAQQVKTGQAQQVIAEIVKSNIPASQFLQAYNAIGNRMFAQSQAPAVTPEVKTETPKAPERVMSDREKELRKQASAGNTGHENAGKRAGDLTVDDIWDMKFEDLMDLDLRELDN